MAKATLTEIRASLIQSAKEGDKVEVNGKTIWAGLGNRSGLHDFAQELLDEKWTKSGARFEKKVAALTPADRVKVYVYHNTTRDRGRWVLMRTF